MRKTLITAAVAVVGVLVAAPIALALTPKDGKWSGTDGRALGFKASLRLSGSDTLKDLDIQGWCGARSGAGVLPLTLTTGKPRVTRAGHDKLRTKFTNKQKFTVASKPTMLPFKTTVVLTFTSSTSAKLKVSYPENSFCEAYSSTYTLHRH